MLFALLRKSASVDQLWTRCFATAAEAHATALKGFEPGRLRPLYLPFQLTAEQAKAKFLEWQRRNKLTPGDLLAPGTFRVHASMLPFWLFGVRAQVTYAGSVGLGTDGQVTWKETEWKKLPVRDYPATDACMQIYASFRYRRDFAEALKRGVPADQLRPLEHRNVQTGEVVAAAAGGNIVALDLPDMRQSVAWDFVLHAIRERETAAAAERLKAEHGVQEVQGVRVCVTPISRRAQLAYLPAYIIDYEYGETLNVHGERRPEQFLAMVSGAEGGGVAGEPHFSAHKASLAAAGGFAAVAMGATAVLSPLLGMDPWALVNIEGAFAVFFIGSTAALTARALPMLLRQRAEERRIAAEDAELQQVLSLGMGPMDSGSEDQEMLRSRAEWRRWEESDKRSWDQAKRQRWAEQLWQAQHRRRRESVRLRQRLQQQQARQEMEDEREQRRQQRWGRSSYQSFFRQQQELFSGVPRPGARHDYLGYYGALGLGGAQRSAAVSQEDIKKAFRRAALRWHPDKQMDERSKRDARDRFHLIRMAYETLRDPLARRAYDRGEAPRRGR